MLGCGSWHFQRWGGGRFKPPIPLSVQIISVSGGIIRKVDQFKQDTDKRLTDNWSTLHKNNMPNLTHQLIDMTRYRHDIRLTGQPVDTTADQKNYRQTSTIYFTLEIRDTWSCVNIVVSAPFGFVFWSNRCRFFQSDWRIPRVPRSPEFCQ